MCDRFFLPEYLSKSPIIKAIGHQEPQLILSILENVVQPESIVIAKDYEVYNNLYHEQGMWYNPLFYKWRTDNPNLISNIGPIGFS